MILPLWRIVIGRAELIDNGLPTGKLSGRGVIYLWPDANEVVDWIGMVQGDSSDMS